MFFSIFNFFLVHFIALDMQVKNVKLRNINHDLLVSWDPVKEPLYDIQRYRVMYK